MTTLASLPVGLPVAVYFIAVAAIGMYIARHHAMRTVAEYFLAGRNGGVIAIGFSLFATTMSAEWMWGVRGVTLYGGILAILGLVALALVIAPRYINSGCFTVPHFIGQRFDRSTMLAVGYASVIFNILVRIPTMLVAGAWLLQQGFGWDIMSSTMVIVVVTGLYTIAGGGTAVLYTQVLQGGAMLIATLLLAVSLIPGGEAITAAIVRLGLSVPLSSQSSISSPSAMPWVLSGMAIMACGYFFADQYTIQRSMFSRGAKAMRGGSFLAALFVAFAVVLLWIVASAESVVDVRAAATTPLSTVVTGMIIAGLFALVMASLSGLFHGTATMIALDLFGVRHPGADAEKLILVGRLSTTGIVIAAVLVVSSIGLIAPVMLSVMLKVQAYIAPPIVAVVFLGSISRKLTARSAIWALAAGAVVGTTHFVATLASSVGGVSNAIADLDIVYVSVLSFVIASLVHVIVSLVAPVPASPVEVVFGPREEEELKTFVDMH